MKQIVGTDPDFMVLDDVPWRPYEGPLNILGHHGRMIKATEALKRIDALRDKARWDRPHRRDE